MTSTFLYWAIIAIVLADFFLDLYLSILQIKASKWPIPKVLEGLYDSEKYSRQQSYFRENSRMGFITGSVSTVIMLAFFSFGGFPWLDGVSRAFSSHDPLRALCFFGIVYLAEWILSLPLDAYRTFVIEQKYGFNKSTPSLFVGDSIKSLLIGGIITGGLLMLCTWLYTLSPEWFWVYAWAVFTVFSLGMQYFYSELIVPLFNKQKPLEEGPLREAIEAFAEKAGFQIENIYVMDSSKRSTKANAYFTGFGKKKRVVLFDTLIEQLSTDEIVGVLAHEIGHYKHNHLVKGMISSTISSLITFWLFSLVIDSPVVAGAALCDQPSFWVNLAVFSMLLSPVGMLLGIVSNAVSRKHERQADAFAKRYGCGPAESSGLKKISAQALSNLTPHPVVVFMNHSHPTLAERVTFLEDVKTA